MKFERSIVEQLDPMILNVKMKIETVQTVYQLCC